MVTSHIGGWLQLLFVTCVGGSESDHQIMNK